MILVDTSVLVAYLRGDSDRAAGLFEKALDQGAPWAITPFIYQELLQGSLDRKEWRRLDEYLRSQVVLDLTDGLDSHREAARIYFDCRRQGLTVRSMVDCLIAQTALEHDLDLLARDRDYRAIARVRKLRFWNS